MTYDTWNYTPDLAGSYVDFKIIQPRGPPVLCLARLPCLNTVGYTISRAPPSTDSDSYGARRRNGYHSSETLQAYLRGVRTHPRGENAYLAP